MSREKKLVKNSIFLLIGQVIPKLTFFVVLPILTAYLSKKEYGIYDLINVLQSLLLPIITLQIQVAAFRYLIENKDDFLEKSKIITNVFLFLVPDIIILIVGTFIVLVNYSIIDKLLITLFLVFELIYNVLGQITRGLLNTKIYSIAGIINSIINMILTIIMVYFFKMGFIGLLVSLCVSVAVPSLFLFFKEKMYDYYDFKLKDKSVIKKLLGYSWPMIPLAISMWIISASDRLIITLFLGIEKNAIYAVARKIPNIITLVQGSFQTAWVESASLAEKDSDSGKYYSDVFETMFRGVSGVTILISAFSPLLFLVLIRGDYNSAYFQIPILLLSMVYFSISSFLGGIYTAKKKTVNVGLTTIGAAIINILIDLLLIKKIGIYAASISTLVSYAVLAIFRMINVKKFVEINYEYKKIVLILLITTLSCLLLYFNNFIINIINVVLAVCVSYYINKKMIIKIVRRVFNKLKRRKKYA